MRRESSQENGMGPYPMILVSILEGKNFPVRHDKKLIVEAKFDGEVMGTEPVPHVTFPQIQTEFGWEVDKKGLQMHRLQRTPIKLLWYAVDKDQMRKESIGYIILDLRQAHDSDLAATWYPLLNCKYHREKPEVLLRLSLEKENNNNNNHKDQKEIVSARTFTNGRDLRRQHSADGIPKFSEKTHSVPTPTPPPPKISSNILEPMLLPDSCYRIGPPHLCQDHFVFSVTLAFAANLNKLAHPSLCLSTDFYFYYSLFHNDVTTGKFHSLLNPDFRAERASIKIFSSSDLLSSYFQRHSRLEVFLYCGDVPLASGNIFLGTFASVIQHDIDREPLSIEDSVKLRPIEKFSKLPISEDLSPFVGVTVVLQKEEEVEEPVQEKPSTPPKVTEPAVQDKAVVPALTQQLSKLQAADCQDMEEINGNQLPSKEIPDFQNQPQSSHNRVSRLQRQQTLNGNRDEHAHGGYFTPNHAKTFSAKTPRTPAGVGGGKATSPWLPNGNHAILPTTNDNVPCHLCFSLHLCNFRAIRLDHPVNLFIRYSYPFFGSSESILTQPDISVLPGTVVNIPAGFCSFNFATTISLLKATFCESPLILEVLHRRNQGTKSEQLIGTSRINLFQIFNSTSTPHMEAKKRGTRQMCSCKVSVVSLEGREIGELNAVITLDDFGPTTPRGEKTPHKAKTPVFPQLRSSLSSFDVTSIRPNGIGGSNAIKSAFDLEVWKEQQRELFRDELKEKEMQHLKVLVSEWKQRDTEREVMLQRRLHECQRIEDKLKQMLQDQEIKQKQLVAQETELALQAQNSEKQREQREKEMTLQIEKLRIEYEDLLRIERLKRLELEENIGNFQRKIHDKETEIHEHRNSIESLRSQINKQPDVELKTEINILKMEKAELQEKYEAASVSKQKYKLQWSQGVRQIAALQQKMRSFERLELSKKDMELANLQQRMLAAAADKRQTPTSDHGILSKITEKVNGLPPSPSSKGDELEQESPSSQSTSESLHSAATLPPKLGIDLKLANLQAQQLTVRRDKLLKSGMYSEADTIIKALNSCIEKSKHTTP